MDSPPTERVYASAADMRANYRAMRARLMSPKPAAPAGAAEVAGDVATPHIAADCVTASVTAIVAAVGAELGL